MSYLSFGEVYFDTSESDIVAVSFELVKAALDSNLHVLLGCNISQAVVFEMLGKERHALNGSIPFLLTATPITDVSDELISPHALVEGSSDSKFDALFEGFKNVQSFLARAMEVAKVEAIDIYFCEGYDEDFDVKSGRPDEVYDYLFNEFEKNGDIPSVRFALK